MKTPELYAVLIKQFQFNALAEAFTKLMRAGMPDAARIVLAQMDELNAEGNRNEHPRQGMEVSDAGGHDGAGLPQAPVRKSEVGAGSAEVSA